MTKQRFVFLGFFMLALMCSQLQWLSHASIAHLANDYYQPQFTMSWMSIDILALLYMVVFLILSFPASYVIDTYGAKKALTFGAGLMFVASFFKALFAQNFILLVLTQFGLAIAQPFILNAITSITMHHFKSNERVKCAGLAIFAQYFGMLAALLLAVEFTKNGFIQLTELLWIYTIISAIVLLGCFFSFPKADKKFKGVIRDRLSFKIGFKLFVSSRDMMLLMLLFAIGLGLINAITSLIDSITASMMLQKYAANIGSIILLGGMIGSVILSVIADKINKRKLLIVISMIALMPLMFVFSFSDVLIADLTNRLNLIYFASFFLGFFIMGIGPIGIQYAAEKTAPAPESVSQGMLLWIGQISGIILVVMMSLASVSIMTIILKSFIFLTFFAFLISLFLQESKIRLN